MNKEDYNNIPVHFCTNCLSLKIRFTDDGIDFCDECGDIDIETTHIDIWSRLYESKYGHKFLKTTKK
mgnify:FL=1